MVPFSHRHSSRRRGWRTKLFSGGSSSTGVAPAINGRPPAPDARIHFVHPHYLHILHLLAFALPLRRAFPPSFHPPMSPDQNVIREKPNPEPGNRDLLAARRSPDSRLIGAHRAPALSLSLDGRAAKSRTYCSPIDRKRG